jgi:hypothetical protein
MKITVKHYDIEVEVTISEDSDFDTVINTMRGILLICGYHHDTIFNNENETENENY